MPRRKAQPAKLTSIIDLPSEDDFANTEEDLSAMLPTPDSSEDKRITAPTKRRAAASTTRARAATKKPGTAPTRKTNTATTGTTKTKRPRPALKDRTNVLEEDEGDDLEKEEVEEEIEEPQRKRAKNAPTAPEVKATKRKPTARAVRAGSAVPAAGRQTSVIPEAQPEPSIEVDTNEYETTVQPPPAPPVVSAQPASRAASRAQSVSRQPDPIASRHRRAGSASSTDRGLGDPALRRKLGEITTKYESLEIKYNNLKDVASAEAQTNFEKLKSATDMRAKSRSFTSLWRSIRLTKYRPRQYYYFPTKGANCSTNARCRSQTPSDTTRHIPIRK
jgi:hypothetical protein